MEVPLKVQVSVFLNGLKEWSIVWFQDKDLTQPWPHWYVITPTSEPSRFLLNMITSQTDKLIKYYKDTKKTKAAKCLVKVSNNEFEFLDQNSVINCNECKRLSIEEIIHKIDEDIGFRSYQNKIPGYLKREIVSAIDQSPLIPPYLKKIAKTTNPL